MNVPTFESEASRDREIPAYDLGRVPYRAALEFQRRAVETRARGESPDVLYFVEHEPVLTVGRGGHDANLRLSAADSRRQVLTRGIDLNALVGREFTVGSVRCRGVELCEPCAHLQSVTQEGVLKGLVHRGGLRADVLNDGDVAGGDAVTSAA